MLNFSKINVLIIYLLFIFIAIFSFLNFQNENNQLIKKKCKKIILGCTELPIALFAYKSFKKAKESKLFIDPNLLLAQICMKKYKNS